MATRTAPTYSWLIAIILIFSAAGIVAGFLKAAAIDLRPGKPATASAAWPVNRQIPRQAGASTLVMIVHPECPCSRASINELAVLMNGRAGKLPCYVLIANVPETGAAMLSLRKTLLEIPGVTPVVDDGTTLSAFHAQTSGQVFLYDAEGLLAFAGGITASRGHEGDNDGLDAIRTFLATGNASTRRTPVFGCSLH